MAQDAHFHSPMNCKKSYGFLNRISPSKSSTAVSAKAPLMWKTLFPVLATAFVLQISSLTLARETTLFPCTSLLNLAFDQNFRFDENGFYYEWVDYDPMEVSGTTAKVKNHRLESHAYAEASGDFRRERMPYKPGQRWKPVPAISAEIVFRSIYKSYSPRVRPKLIKLVRAVEESLPLERESVASVIAHPRGVGFLRVFDGTPYFEFYKQGGGRKVKIRANPYKRSLLVPIQKKIGVWGAGNVAKFRTDPRLPMERIFEARGIKVSSVEKWREMAVNLDGNQAGEPLKIYEVGKFFNDTQGEGKNRVRNFLHRWLLEKFCNGPEEAIFFAHVATEAHKKFYMKVYGFTVEEVVDIDQQEDDGKSFLSKEYILKVDKETLRNHLLVLLGISNEGVAGP